MRMIIRNLQFIVWVMICIILTAGITWAKTEAEHPNPVLTTSLDRDTARVGEMVGLVLKFRIPAGARLPENPEIKGLEGLTIVERMIERNQIHIRFLIDRLGHWESGPISLTYFDKEGKEQKMHADPVSLTVLSNLGEKPEEAGLKPIQDIIPTDRKWMTYLYWSAAIAGLFFFIAGLTWWYRKRHSRVLFPEVFDPPHIRAKKEIDQLESQKLFEKGKIKAFYFIFSEILRRYMESIRHFPAAESTTEEIARHIGNNKQDQKILPLLRQADLVKFADTVPTPAHKDDDIRVALSYIEETTPVTKDIHPGSAWREEPR
jgi:hypothetical protein